MHPLCLAETPGLDQSTTFKMVCTLDDCHDGDHYDGAFLRSWKRPVMPKTGISTMIRPLCQP